MQAWEKLYKKEVLNQAIELEKDVSIKSNDGVQIIAQVGDYEVETYLEYGTPLYPSCSCPEVYPCKHEAAVTYHIINHPEIYQKNPDFEEIFNLVNSDDLKNFLLGELKSNPDLKDKFLKRFSDNHLNKQYYRDKLDKIFKKGEGRDFEYHGFYDLDLMKDELYDFIIEDIYNILSTDHNFACELMIRIAELLNDEVISTRGSWYDLADRFMEQVNVLLFSIYLDAEKLDELNANTDHIINLL